MDSFRSHYKRRDVQVVVKRQFEAVAKLFPDVPYTVDDGLVDAAQGDKAMQNEYDNALRFDGAPFYTHPCFTRTKMRADHLTTKPEASQADMYRIILGLPPTAPLTLPAIQRAEPKPNTVLIIPKATSWPNTQPGFWLLLEASLRSSGRNVLVNSPNWSLQELFARCAGVEWVIAPQCGVLSILCTGEFPCRKTVATPSVDDFQEPEFLAKSTYPYGYVTKFANDDYDVEEFKITRGNHAELVDAIVHGQNALRIRPYDPRPVTTITLPLSPGDALDRQAVLSVKRARWRGAKRAAVEREYRRHVEATRYLLANRSVSLVYDQLLELHAESFDRLERMVPIAIASDEMSAADHVEAVKANRRRIDLKQQIDAICHAPYAESKSYYPDN